MSRGKLEGRVALITGAGRGIGRAIAHSYAREGAAVAITARSVDELQSLVEGIRQNSGKGIAIPADLTDVSTLLRVIEGVIESPGAIDILVNNAGIGSAGPSPVFSFDDALWIRTLALNLTAPHLLTKAVLPALLAKKWGRIINIAWINSKIPSIHAAAYVASNYGLLRLTRAVALESRATESR